MSSNLSSDTYQPGLGARTAENSPSSSDSHETASAEPLPAHAPSSLSSVKPASLKPILPSALQPVTRAEAKAASEAKVLQTKKCKCCDRELLLDFFGKLKKSGRHSYCYECRVRRRETNPSIVRKLGYIQRAKSKPC